MKTQAFGLDIGTTATKAVYISRDKTVLTLEAHGVIASPPKAMYSESEKDQTAMVEALQTLLKASNMPVHGVTVALSDSQVYTKVLELPILTDKELSSAIYWEAEQYIPVPLSTITLDYQVLHRDEASKINPKMYVLLVGAQIELVKRYQNILSLANLSIISIETETLAIVRALTNGMQVQNLLVVNIGANTTSIAILQNGSIIFTYSIPLGGNAMNRAIATEFGFALDQAEQYKRTYGIADKNIGGKMGKAIEPILLAMLTEIKKALTFYNDRFKESSMMRQIILSGGSAKMPGMDLFFAQNCGMETIVANPWKMNNIGNVSAELLEQGPEYTVAVGLALKEYED